MLHTYIVPLNYTFTVLNGHPSSGTFHSWCKYQSATPNGNFPDQNGGVENQI